MAEGVSVFIAGEITPGYRLQCGLRRCRKKSRRHGRVGVEFVPESNQLVGRLADILAVVDPGHKGHGVELLDQLLIHAVVDRLVAVEFEVGAVDAQPVELDAVAEGAEEEHRIVQFFECMAHVADAQVGACRDIVRQHREINHCRRARAWAQDIDRGNTGCCGHRVAAPF